MLFQAIIGVCSMLPFLSITPVIKEAVNLRKNNFPISTAQIDAINKFNSQLTMFMVY